MNIQKIKIPVNEDTILAGMFLTNSAFFGKRPVILVIHGWTSSMVRYPARVESLIDVGYSALLFDLRGHGESDGQLGNLSPHDHFNDCLAAYDNMIAMENADVDNISVIGSSYGGYLASLLIAKRKVHHLVLSVPALYPNSIFDNPKGLQRSEETTNYRTEFHFAKDDFALHAVNQFKGDLLFIQAEKDEILSPTVMECYKKAAQVHYTYKEIKGSDHAMHTPGANEERMKIQKEWFNQFI